jgi:Fe-S oxidoreductase
MDSEYRDILHRCFRCGWCKLPTNYADFNCPAYLKHRFESFASGGRMWLIRAWIEGEIAPSERFNQILFSCVTCGNCVEACAMDKIKDKLVDVFIAARRDLVEEGRIPPGVRDYFKAVSISGNPYKKSAEETGLWAGDLDIEEYNGHEYLLYAGSVASFDDLGMRMARSAAALFKQAGLSFGILKGEEVDDGNDLRASGEQALADFLASRNIETFNRKGVRKIITLSPHSFHAMRKDYPALGGTYEVYHYSQVLALLIEKGALVPGELGAGVTYHDPCYLGRWNKEYFSSRRVLNGVRGITVLEMDRSMQNALCCGGGGGNFFTDILGTGRDLSSRARVREALDTGAGTLVVSCPQCYRMLDDAVKAEGAQDRLKISDLAEIVSVSIGET